MAFFDKFKKKKDGEGDGGHTPDPKAAPKPNPAKAQAWFDRAKGVHDATNYEYAMTLWLQGMRWDPDSVDAIEGFAQSAKSYLEKIGKPKKPTGDQIKNTPSDGEMGKYLQDLLHWGCKGFDWHTGLRAMNAANKLESHECAFWLGERVEAGLKGDPKAKKDNWVALMEGFAAAHGWQKAVEIGEIALELDPTDGQLPPIIKNYSANAAMSSGSFDQSDQEGGFRSRIKDEEGQKEAAEEDMLVKDEQSLDRMIATATSDWNSRRDDLGAITKLARLLRERGTSDDQKAAFQVLMKGYEATKVYRLKQEAGDIRIRVAKRKIRAMKDKLALTPDDAGLQQTLGKAVKSLHAIEVEEFAERVANSPTDLKLKYELGRLKFEDGEFEDAIEQLQQAQSAQGVQAQALMMLGRSFHELAWLDEAERTFRGALERVRGSDETMIEFRYRLLVTLKRKAQENQDLAAAQEALELASGIAVQQINYKDIRTLRSELSDLVKRLRDG